MSPPKYILPVIVISQFCCTSLWFASNGVLGGLSDFFLLSENALGLLTSAVQLGFISGTLLFAIFTIADRYSPSRVFLISALLGALFNVAAIWDGNTLYSLLTLRFLTGFFLAGIYPVGMKIASDYYDKGLGTSLGYLVGALVLGTALPHLLNDLAASFSFKFVLIAISVLAAAGGITLQLLVPDGPYRKPGLKLDPQVFFEVFRKRSFRAAAFGYFGHMWELYAFWAFVPVMLTTFDSLNPTAELNISVLSFLVIGAGGLACVLGGYISRWAGVKRTASVSLLLSGCCCLISPLFLTLGNELLFIGFLLFWGMVVIADSPLFSTLVAKNALGRNRGTALTIVNCIGFAITIFSIQLLSDLYQRMSPTNIYMFLAIGPLFGLISLGARREE